MCISIGLNVYDRHGTEIDIVSNKISITQEKYKGHQKGFNTATYTQIQSEIFSFWIGVQTKKSVINNKFKSDTYERFQSENSFCNNQGSILKDGTLTLKSVELLKKSLLYFIC